MKKYFLIAIAIVCVRGIWAQTEETDSVSVSSNKSNSISAEIQAIKEIVEGLKVSVKNEEFDCNKPIYKPFYDGKKKRWYQEQLIIFSPMVSFAKDIDNDGLDALGGSFTNKDEEAFDEATNEADPKTGFSVSVGYVRTFIRGKIADERWQCNRWGHAYNVGALFDYKRHNTISNYSIYGLLGTEFGHFHKYGIGVNTLFGFGTGLGYLYDLDDPNEKPEEDPKLCFKVGGEFWLRLGGKNGGFIPGVETRFFVRVIYAFDGNEYDKGLNLYRFSSETVTDAGFKFVIPF